MDVAFTLFPAPPAYQPLPSDNQSKYGGYPPQSYPSQGYQAQHAGYDQPPAGVVVVQPQQTVIVPAQDTSHVEDYLIANIFACICCCWILGKKMPYQK